MNNIKRNVCGFTLIEMLLVLVIISAIMVGMATYSKQRIMQLKQDRVVLQIQQILNAGLAYYLNQTAWPDSMQQLQGDNNNNGGYLPGPYGTVNIVSPWGGQQYQLTHTPNNASAPNAMFGVCLKIDAGPSTPAIAKTLAGRLPMAYTAAGNAVCSSTSGLPAGANCTTAPCTVVATVNVPGQNLNNARSVNLAGLYHHGACVPVPNCPGNMVPKIYVVPSSVSGMNESVNSVNPISSFTAYVSGSDNPQACPPKHHPCGCNGDNYYAYCPDPQTQNYWRVCLQIITTRGQVVYKASSLNDSTNSTARLGTSILAITRCAPAAEDDVGTNGIGNPVGGSSFNVFSYGQGI